MAIVTINSQTSGLPIRALVIKQSKWREFIGLPSFRLAVISGRKVRVGWYRLEKEKDGE